LVKPSPDIVVPPSATVAPSARAVDVVEDAVTLVGVDDRPHVGVPISSGANHYRLRPGDQPVDELIVQLPGHQCASAGFAYLSGVDEAAVQHPVDGKVEVGVVQDDRRALAAEFERDLLDVPGGQPHDLATHRGGPGERDLADVGMAGQAGTGLGTVTGHDVEHSGRQAVAFGDAGEFQDRERGVFVGFDHHAVAGRQRGADLPQRQQQRKVPRRNRADHPDRFAVNHALAQGGERRDGTGLLPVVSLGEVSEIAEMHKGITDVKTGGLADGGPVAGHLQLDELLGHVVGGRGDLPHDGGTLLRRLARPHAAVERVLGGGDRGVDMGGIALGDGGDHGFVAGVNDRHTPVRVDGLSADQHQMVSNIHSGHGYPRLLSTVIDLTMQSPQADAGNFP
jgi:hypothetical protein